MVKAQDDGQLGATYDRDANAGYVRVRIGVAARTAELIEGRLMADFDRDGNLLGVEVIGPRRPT